VKVAFLINDLQLSGGIGVVLHHARELGTRHGFDVSLVLAREQNLESWDYDALEHVHVVSLTEAQRDRFYVAVCTWWGTALVLFTLTADRYAYFVQSLEDRFYQPHDLQRMSATLTLDLPVAFITEARWIADTLAEIRPDARCHLVRNGIDKEIFAGPESVTPRLEGPLRILVEGHPTVWFKHVGEAVRATELMTEPRHVTLVTAERDAAADLPADRLLGPVAHRELANLYGEHEVVLKLSSVEGMFGPPLEGFHMGATCVVTPVTGHEEYVTHAWNGLVCDWDDPRGTARLLDLLARDRFLLHFLRGNALLTARGWPSWRQQGQFMAGALRAIAHRPAPRLPAPTAALTRDLRALLDAQALVLAERNALRWQASRFQRIKQLAMLAPLRRVWRQPLTQRLAGPLVERLKRRLREG
jgi:glycosyltransferase involved in cell wall biosynthesis